MSQNNPAKGKLWKWFYDKWGKTLSEPVPGYTILLPVPGDLPVFLKIALEVCATQDSEHLVETMIIPDRLTSGLPELIETWKKDYLSSPVRLVNLKSLEQIITRYQNNPGTNHWLQLITGVEAARTTHVLLHDADLFIPEPNFLKLHYQTCVEKNYSCLGLSPVWDSWYQEQGINHLTATWEILFDTAWLRSFQPWQHRGHDDLLDGKWHTFDTTLWPQCQTLPERVGRHQQEWGFIHFNYVISTYRWFQKSKGPFEDQYFRLLLVRLLIDAYDRSGWVYEVPTLAGLVEGLNDSSNRVTYIQEQTRQKYPEFRLKLQRLIDSGLLDDEKVTILCDGVQPFDRVFGKELQVI